MVVTVQLKFFLEIFVFPPAKLATSHSTVTGKVILSTIPSYFLRLDSNSLNSSVVLYSAFLSFL